MGILSDFYNTVARFFQRNEEQSDESKSIATNRLKLVLMQDRTNLTPKILEQMRGELVDLLSRYLEMDKELLELNFEQEGDQVALMLSIPVIRAKDEEEIEAYLASKENKEETDEAQDSQEAEEQSEAEEAEEETNENSEEGESSNTDEISSENQEEISDNQDSEEKPKSKSGRKTKKVSAPEELKDESEQNETSSENEFENTEA